MAQETTEQLDPNVSPDDVDIFYTYSPSRDTPPQKPVRILDAK